MLSKYAGYSGTDIVWVSDTKYFGGKTVKIPKRVQTLDPKALMRYYKVKGGRIVHKYKDPERIALISTFDVNCGIATFSKYLADAIHPNVKDIKIFAETNENAGSGLHPYPVVRCWNRQTGYEDLIENMITYDPDLIIIQHEFSFFHKINWWNTLMSQLGRWRTLVTFHTVLEHRVNHPQASLNYRSKAFAEAACPEIVVHSKKARETLRDRGYAGRVHYIPHGCFPPEKLPHLPVEKYGMYPKQSLFQYGFGGRYKGWEFAINTMELVVKDFPDACYVGVFNVPVSDDLEYERYYKTLLDMIRDKKLTKNVAIHYGYQETEMLRNFLRGSKIAFFPYQTPANWASWGASGAIQLPLSLGTPTILGDYPAFYDFKGLLPVVKTIEEAALEIKKIFEDPNHAQLLSDTAFKIAEERKWANVANWYLDCQHDRDFDAL
jgi:glycosyltransferase involved in cell wall biosynthesis